MSVSSNDPRRTYNGDGVSVNFATPYFLTNADLKVYVGGVLKTITTDYTVIGAGVTAGGTVTFLSAPAAGTGNVAIIREPDQLQSSQLPSNDPFPSKTVETMIDKLTMIVQRLFDKLTRTLTLSDTDSSSVSLTLPPASALKFFRWNASANAIENVDISTLSAVALPIAVAQGGTGSTTAAGARTALAARGEADDVTLVAGKVVIFEGATDDAFETTLTVVDPTADRTLSLPNKSGTLATLDDLTSSVQIQPISASVGSNALTISASALSLDFRSATLGSGAVTKVSGTPSNLVISSGSTLGTVSGQQSRIAVLALNNAGTIELAAVNLAGGNDLTETGLISTTAEGGAGAADSANVVYSTTARTNVAYRVIGYIESTQATAGTWATAPSTIQGAGGQALTAMSSLGYGQTWQNVTGSRAKGTTYYNTTGRPIVVNINCTENAVNSYSGLTVGGVLVANNNMANGSNVNAATISAIVPPAASYVWADIGGVATLTSWLELR